MIIILVIFILTNIMACFKMMSIRSIANILSTSIILCIIMWYILPGIIVLLYPYNDICSTLFYNISENEFLLAYAMESASIFFIIFAISKWHKQHRFTRTDFGSSRFITEGRVIAISLIFLYFVFVVYKANFGSFDYFKNNDASFYNENSASSIINFVGQCLFSAMVIMLMSLPYRGFMLYVTFALICAESYLDTMAGSRISMLTPLVLIAFRHGARVNFKTFVLGLFLLFIILFVILPLSYFIAEIRGHENADYSDIDTTNKIDDIMSMLFEKTNSFSAGVALLNGGADVGSVGLMPYYGSVLVFLPRFVWPDRPVAGSSDGTILGHPSRVCP